MKALARECFALVFLPLFGFLVLPAHAQAVTFGGGLSTIGGGFKVPNAVAVDGSGNVYIADTVNLAVKQMPANCFSSDCVTTLGGNFAFIGPQNVAVDGNGNVYVVDYSKGVGHIYEMSPNCASSSCVTELAGGFFIHPYAVAVDSSENVYVANNPLISHNGIFEMPPNCFSSTCVSLLQGSPTDSRGLAVDSSGNIYTTSYYGNKVYEMAAGCNSSSCTITTLGTGFTYAYPYGVAVDGSGNVFVTSNYWGILYELSPGCTSASCVTTLNADWAGVGVAAGAPGKVYFAATYAGGSLNNQVEQVQLGSVNFLPTAVGSSSSSIALWFTFPPGVTPGTASALTQGAPNLDFTTTTSPSCAGTNAGDVCEFQVTFAPTAPGQRNGAIVVSDSDGNVLSTANVYGTGIAPQIAFNPSPKIPVGSGFAAPLGAALDGSGNLFVADVGGPGSNGAVYEVLAAGGYTTVKPLGGGFVFGNVRSLSVDGRGNVFAVQQSNSSPVYEIPAAGSYSTVQSVSPDFSNTLAIALDGSGNLFITANYGDVYELPVATGYSSSRLLAQGYADVLGVTVDGSGDVFFTNYDPTGVTTGIYEILAMNGVIPANPTINTLGGGFAFAFPAALTLEASGNLLVTDITTQSLYELPAAGGYNSVNTLFVGLQSAGLALDATSNIFFTDTVVPGAFELQRFVPPSLSFASTTVGLTSSDSPQSVLIENVGNATLTGSGLLSDTTDFSPIAGSGTPPDCTLTALSLSPGAECNVSLNFTPQSAAIFSATLTLTDNALNGNPATQTIPLSGTGVALPPQAQLSASALQFGALAFPTSSTLPLTITNIGGGTLTIATSINGPSYTIASSTCTSGVTAGNSCTLQVLFNAELVGNHVDNLTLTTNSSTNPVVTLHGIATGVGAKTQSQLAFPTIPYGTSEVLPLTIVNYGVPGTVTLKTSINGPSFKVLNTAQNTCNAGVATGHTCILPIEFIPAATGYHKDILTLTPTGGAAVSTVIVKGTGD